MPGIAGDALLASADADKVPKVSDLNRLEHLAGSAGFQVEATESDRLPRLLSSVDSTLTEVSDPDGLEHLAGTVGFHVEATESDHLPLLLAQANATPPAVSDPDGLEHLAGTVGFHVEATESNRLPRLFASLDANLPLEQLAGMLAMVFHVETTTESDYSADLVRTNDDAYKLIDLGKIVEFFLRSHSSSSKDQQMRRLKDFAEVSIIGYVRMSWGTIILMDGTNCFIWKFRTGETLRHLCILDLVNPFPPVHSSIVQATTTWPLRTLVRFDDMTWYSQPRRDWVNLPDSVLQDIISDLDCTRDFNAFAYTCKSWQVASAFHPRPLLLHPLASPSWLFVTPGGICNNQAGNFRLFPAQITKEHSTLIGGSTQFLIFLDDSCCCILNMHTGHSIELKVPSSEVCRAVLSAPPDSGKSNILLVTGTSVLCKSINCSDEWRLQNFGDIPVGPIDDIVFVGNTAYMIDKNSRLFIITPALEIIFCPLGDFRPRLPISIMSGFGRSSRRSKGKREIHKNWLMEQNGELWRLSLMSYTVDTEVFSGFFMSRIGSDRFHKIFKDKSERAGLPSPSKYWPAETWIEMGGTELGDICVFLNTETCVASFVSEKPGRWGLERGQVFTCGPAVFPWLSFNLGWVREDNVTLQNIRWPCPVFMDSGFSFVRKEELDHRVLLDKASESTALNLHSASSSSHTLPSEAHDLSSTEEAS